MSGPSLTSYNDDAQRSWLHQVKSLQLSNETEGERGVLRRQSSLSENSFFFVILKNSRGGFSVRVQVSFPPFYFATVYHYFPLLLII